jgi:uncharacterized glyoxalase superfamily protein PhnB
LKVSSAFYKDVLGFEIHPMPHPGLMIYSSGNCTIMAGECRDAIPPAELGDHSYFAYLEIAEIDAFYQAIISTVRRSVRPSVRERGECGSSDW